MANLDNRKRRGSGNYDGKFNREFVNQWLNSREGKDFIKAKYGNKSPSGITERMIYEAKRQYHAGWRPTRQMTKLEQKDASRRANMDAYAAQQKRQQSSQQKGRQGQGSKPAGWGVTGNVSGNSGARSVNNAVMFPLSGANVNAGNSYTRGMGVYERIRPVSTYSDQAGNPRVKTGKGNQTRWTGASESSRVLTDRSGNTNVWSRGKSGAYETGEKVTGRNTAGHYRSGNGGYDEALRSHNTRVLNERAARMNSPMNGMSIPGRVAPAFNSFLRGLGVFGGIMGVKEMYDVMDHISKDRYLRGGERQVDGSWANNYGDDNSAPQWNYLGTGKNGRRAVDFGRILENGHMFRAPNGEIQYFLGDPRQYGSDNGTGFGVGMGAHMGKEPLSPHQARALLPYMDRIPEDLRPDVERIAEGYTREMSIPEVTVTARRKKPQQPARRPAKPVQPAPAISSGGAPLPIPGQYLDPTSPDGLTRNAPDTYRHGEHLSPGISGVINDLKSRGFGIGSDPYGMGYDPSEDEGLFALGYNPFAFRRW